MPLEENEAHNSKTSFQQLKDMPRDLGDLIACRWGTHWVVSSFIMDESWSIRWPMINYCCCYTFELFPSRSMWMRKLYCYIIISCNLKIIQWHNYTNKWFTVQQMLTISYKLPLWGRYTDLRGIENKEVDQKTIVFKMLFSLLYLGMGVSYLSAQRPLY